MNDLWKFNPSTNEWTWMNGKGIVFESVNGKNAGTKLFKVPIIIDGEKVSEGTDYSKKGAEQIAAEGACKVLSITGEQFMHLL